MNKVKDLNLEKVSKETAEELLDKDSMLHKRMFVEGYDELIEIKDDAMKYNEEHYEDKKKYRYAPKTYKKKYIDKLDEVLVNNHRRIVQLEKQNMAAKKQMVVAHGMLEDLSVFASAMKLYIQEKGLDDEFSKYCDEFYEEARKQNNKIGKVDISFDTFKEEGGERNA